MYFNCAQRVEIQQNIELTTFALTWCPDIFCWMLGDPHFFFGRSLPFMILSIIVKKKFCTWDILIISHILFKRGRIGTWIQVCVT